MKDILELKEEIDKLSHALLAKASQVGGDVLFKRDHPEIRKIWNNLCKAHMKAMVVCIDRAPQDSKMATLCDEIERPRACIEALHLSEEETCCGRFMNRMKKLKA